MVPFFQPWVYLCALDVPLAIQGYKETVRCVVIDLSEDYDVILGDGWLYEHAGVLHFDPCSTPVH